MKNNLFGRADAPRHWLFVLCLIGLDYFSTLAYLPSIAVDAAGSFAPLSALLIVLVTWLLVVPVYAYIVGRSPRGRGAIGLLDQLIAGWRGKLIVLALLGFAAADFVVTRSLSIADATEHLLHNPHGHELLDGLAPVADECRVWLGDEICDRVAPYLSRPVLVTLALSMLTFGFWYLLRRGFTRGVALLATVVVGCYLTAVGIVVGSGLVHIAKHPPLVFDWLADIGVSYSAGEGGSSGEFPWAVWFAAAIWAFPQVSLGLSGFELTMTVAPLVRGSRRDTASDPAAMVRNARKLIFAAAAVMGVLLIGSTLVSTLLIPRDALAEGGPAAHRALAYLAHGAPLADGQPATVLNPLFGDPFGNAFDAASTAILCLAGASVMVGLARLVPGYLHRAGMDLSWAGNVGIVMHVLNAVILIVTVAFRASLADQLWAYATSVLVLIGGAALAATLDARRRWSGSWVGPCIAGVLGVAFLAFVAAVGLTVSINRSGLVIALAFVAAIFATSLISRWLRSTELRFEGFTFADAESRARWQQFCDMDRLILVPHRPGWSTPAERNRMIREEYLLSPDAPLVFVEVALGDPSEFYQRPRVRVEREGDLEIIRVSSAVSVSHVLAAIALEMAKVGRPPTLIFGWSFETPLAANLSFLFLGEGNIPWMVKALVRRAAPRRHPSVSRGSSLADGRAGASPRPRARLVLRRKVVGDLLGDFSGRRPFRAALERRDEADAFHRVVGVSHRRVEHAAFTVVDREDHRFVRAAAAGLGIGPTRGEHGHVLGRAAKPVVQFVLGVEPDGGHALRDRVVAVANDDLKLVLRAVAAAVAFGLVAHELVVLEIDIGTGLFVASAPAAEADDLVVLLPVAEGVVGGVDDDEPATVLDVPDEILLHVLWPGSAVVVGDDDLVVGELGIPAGEILARGRGRDVDRKEAGFFEGPLEDRRGGLPVVVVLAIDDQGFELFGGWSSAGSEKCQRGDDERRKHESQGTERGGHRKFLRRHGRCRDL